MKRWTGSGDVVLHAVLIEVRGLETRDQQLGKLVDNGIESVNARNVQTTDGGGDAGGTGRHHVEVIQTDETFASHIYGQPVGGEEVSAEDGVCDFR